MTSFVIKLIAIVTMLIDHMGIVLFPGNMIFRLIGRTAFPLFAFMIAEGFSHTRNAPRYLLRLTMFALVSQIPFNLMGGRGLLSLTSLNVFFTLAMGLLAIIVYEIVRTAPPLRTAPKLISQGVGLIAPLALAWVAEYFHTDYGWRGVILIVAFHIVRKRWQVVLCVVALLAYYQFGPLMRGSISWMYLGVLLAIPPLYFYNGQKGPSMPKFVFYAFYPGHMLILVAIKQLIQHFS